MEESVVLSFLIKQMETMLMELPRVSQISEQWNRTFDFTETVNNYGLNQGTLC